MCIVVGDLHLKREEPYKTAQEQFLKFLQKYYNDEIIVFLGDSFDSSSPHWDTYTLFKDYLLNRNNETHILIGSHDKSIKKGVSISNLSLLSSVYVYESHSEVMIEGKKCLMISNIYEKMKEKCEAITGTYDYVFTHITPMQCAFGDEGIQLNVKAKEIIHGHTHHSMKFIDGDQSHIVLGLPYITRHLEQNQDYVILEIDKNDNLKYIPVPQYFTFRDIEYGDEIKEQYKNDIFNVKNAPAVSSVNNMYKDYYIRDAGITLKEFDEESDTVFEFSEDALKSSFIEFSKEKELSKKHINRIMGYVDK